VQNRHLLTPTAGAAFDRVLAAVVEPGLAGRPAPQREAFGTRLERFFGDMHAPFMALYGERPDAERELDALLGVMVAADAARRPDLRRLDHEREITPDWLHREQAVGYVAYVDRFAGSLEGVRRRLPYLRELGVSYLHLMPLLAARPAPNDGGYAVVDFGAVEPALGTMADLRALADELRAESMSLCIDLVLNHTAREHPWAVGAVAGRPELLSRYLTFPDRTLPDAYERTLPEVFPDVAPGSFTWVDGMAGEGRWVWTTFNDFQWDLDHSNPVVLRELAGIMLELANQGVDVLRLDAVPFLWKRLGTNCQNQPEVHDLLQALRTVVRIVAPAMALKAEAIVSPRDLVAYLGQGRHEGRECDLAYHNSLMVLLWSSLASRRVTLMTHALRSMPPTPPNAGWVTYVRGHDDIGWAITEEDAGAAGENGHLHRRFLADFYAGEFPGSFARGERFQVDPGSGEARTSGSAASLAGLEGALAAGDEHEIELAIRRILLLYGVAFSYGGLPLVYMGDEVGLPNDHSYLADPTRAHDNRWMHRPQMDWEAAQRRADPATSEGRLWAGVRRLVHARRASRALHTAGEAEPLWSGNAHVFAYARRHAGEALLALANFTEAPQDVSLDFLHGQGFRVRPGPGGPDDRPLRTEPGLLVLEPYQFTWLEA
jgi:amylosucrase